MTAQVIQADPVRDVCGQLARYLGSLRPLLPEPDSPAGYATPGAKGALAHAPLPGNAAALLAMMGIHGAARWWEAMLLYHLGADDPWGRHGGTDAGTLRALDSIVRLAQGADDDVLEMLLADLGRAEADAGVLPAIDEVQRWRYLRGRRCPHSCGCYALKVLLNPAGGPTRHVECWGVGCRDSDGRRPVAEVGVDERGVPGLRWECGLWEPVPDMED